MPIPPLHILAVAPQYPGKLGPLAVFLARLRGCRVTFLHHRAEPGTEPIPGPLHLAQYHVGGVARDPAVAWERHLERGLCHAYGAFERLRDQPLRPVDLILGHSDSLGSTLFLADLFPGVPILQRMDPFLRPCGQDLADEDREPLGLEYSLWRRSANAMNLLELENGVRPWVASAWTRSTYPDEYHASLSVHPEPVDHRRLRRAGPPHRTIAGRTLEPPTRLVTFAAGSADRLRGVDHFLKLAERLLAARSDVVCALAGDPMVVRGLDIRDYGQSTLERLLATSPIAHHDRLWCLGRLDPETRRALLHRTNLYVAPGRLAEPTRILGEALAAGCVALAWDLEPLREWITPNVNGLLVPAYDLTALFDLAQAVLDHPADYAHLAQTAAESIVTQRDPGTFVDSLIEPIWAQAPTNPRSRTAV